MFWIVPEGKTIAADEAEVQNLVDAGRVDLDIQSQDSGSAWTKPAALGFIAKPALSVSSKPAPIIPILLPLTASVERSSPTTPIPVESAAMAPPSISGQLGLPEAASVTPRTPSPVSTAPNESTRPFVLLDFAMEIVAGMGVGTKFRLADGTQMESSLQETGTAITGDIVRQALEHVEKEYKSRGLTPELMKMVEIQQSVVLLAAVLNYQAKLTGGLVSRHLIEFSAAVSDLQHTLHIVTNSRRE